MCVCMCMCVCVCVRERDLTTSLACCDTRVCVYYVCAGAVPPEPAGSGAVLCDEPAVPVLLLCAPCVLLVPGCLPADGRLAPRQPAVC